MNAHAAAPRDHAVPGRRDILAEQIRTVALVLRIPALLAVAAITFATFINLYDFIQLKVGVEFAPELSMIPAAAGALFPLGIWKREERIGGGFFWSMPVDRREHALIKVLAGWVCLMAAVALFMIWLLLLAAVTGGNIIAPHELVMLPSAIVPPNGTLTEGELRTVLWTPMPTLWIAPFTAATGLYLMTSAFALGSRYPLRWMIGVVLCSLLLSLSGTVAHVDWMRFAPARFISIVHEGRYGLDALMTARTESLKTAITLADGTSVSVWRGLPNLREWVIASVLWIALGMALLWIAASRHREQRTSSHFNTTD